MAELPAERSFVSSRAAPATLPRGPSTATRSRGPSAATASLLAPPPPPPAAGIRESPGRIDHGAAAAAGNHSGRARCGAALEPGAGGGGSAGDAQSLRGPAAQQGVRRAPGPAAQFDAHGPRQLDPRPVQRSAERQIRPLRPAPSQDGERARAAQGRRQEHAERVTAPGRQSATPSGAGMKRTRRTEAGNLGTQPRSLKRTSFSEMRPRVQARICQLQDADAVCQPVLIVAVHGSRCRRWQCAKPHAAERSHVLRQMRATATPSGRRVMAQQR